MNISQRGINDAHKSMEISAASFVTREMQVKTT